MTDRPERLRAVLFDWDGTLVDSAEVSFRCYEHVFSSFGIGFDRAGYERTYSPDWYRTYEGMGLPRECWSRADALWLERYTREPSRLLPEAAATLARVDAAGLAQALVSSGDRSRVRAEAERLGVARYFRAMVCAGDTAARKPDPAPLLLALSRLGVAPAEAAYVGDSPEDVFMARAGGVFVAGVPGGFPNRAALRASAPDLWADTLTHAADALLARP
jgi:HAD superfamily hydrolase (TIGR01549 family)